MLSLVKEKLLSVQEGIASSFKGVETVRAWPKDFNAGAKLLSKYQSNWEEIHSLTEENSKKAVVVDRQISEVYDIVKNQRFAIKKFNSDVTDLGVMTVLTEKAVNAIGNIRSLIDEIQNEIIAVEDLIDEEELLQKKHDAEENLKVFRSEQLISLDALRERLAEDYEDKINGRERPSEDIKKKNYEIAEKKFLRDITVYKQTGELPKHDTTQPSLSIDEVEIEQDLDVLQEYLQT